MPLTTSILLLLLLPLISFVVMGLFGRSYLKQAAGWISTLLMGLSALLAMQTAYGYFFSTGKVQGIYQAMQPFCYHWLEFSPSFSIDIGCILDPLSAMMLVVVTLISFMVHVYSLEYLKGESRQPTYYAFLGLFTFSMLGLVIASNLFQIYIFWELVGVSSFLLIGYYFDKPSAVAASKKAFIVTRFADLGFLIGILVVSYYAHSFDFKILIQRLSDPQHPALKSALTAGFMGCSALSWGMALIFIGGAGKSAMFPLHIWLPDAMEGPTPVSALIHAATMVVAGVYLVARLFPVYAHSTPSVLHGIAWVGVFSSAFAALIACTQTDIKRVLAYSTMSQIGFMMFALGVSGYGGEEGLGYTASLFHLFTHALFKALLFLGAGAVIHAVHSNEMKDMGGLRKQLPITHITFLIACLAISGIPPFAGFFSKEEILLAAYQRQPVIYGLALCISGLTAFYMFRLYFSIFWHRAAAHHESHEHQGEGGMAMMLPLILLALGSISAGWLPFGTWVSSDGHALPAVFHPAFSVAPVALGAGGALLAMWLYKKENNKPERFSTSAGWLYTWLYRKFYIDEVYLFLTKKILFPFVGRPAAWVDREVVDGLVNATGNFTQYTAEKIKKLQSGRVQEYALYFLAGAIALALCSMYLWK